MDTYLLERGEVDAEVLQVLSQKRVFHSVVLRIRVHVWGESRRERLRPRKMTSQPASRCPIEQSQLRCSTRKTSTHEILSRRILSGGCYLLG